MDRLNELRERGRMRSMGHDRGWVAAPDDIVNALCDDGFEECKREVTRTRRDKTPTGGVWQGVNTQTGSVASAIWVTQRSAPDALVFIEIDGERVEAPGG